MKPITKLLEAAKVPKDFLKNHKSLEPLKLHSIIKARNNFSKMEQKETRIGGIGNQYGALVTKKETDKYFWGIQDFDSTEWEEIPQYLYEALIKFENT